MTLQEQVTNSFQVLWEKIAGFLPNFIAAILILLLGWLVGSLVGQLIAKLLEVVQIDKLADRLGLDRLSSQVGRKLSISGLGGWLVKWFIIVASFVAATDILNMTRVSDFLYQEVIPYFGNVIIAVIILFIGTIAANWLAELVKGAVKASGVGVANAMSAVTRWAIMIFAILAALTQLNIAPTFLQTLFIGIIAMFALAGGLAFGLGGRAHAEKIWAYLEKNLIHRD